MNFTRYSIALLFLFPFVFACGQESDPFQDGCCVNANIPRPVRVSQETVSRKRLLTALNCAIRGLSPEGAERFAELRNDRSTLRVAYYFGRYIPEQNGKALTIAVYAEDGSHGMLYDTYWNGRRYYVSNAPALLRGPKQWRVGEINGGLMSYTRLWYLAQEIGSRPRLLIPAQSLIPYKPAACTAMY